MKQKLPRRFGPLFGFILFPAALWVLQYELQEYPYTISSIMWRRGGPHQMRSMIGLIFVL